MSEAEKIAAGLTEAQKRAALTSDSGFAECHKGKWAFMTKPTYTRLHELGLITKAESLAVPTPLGLAVRAVLQEQSK